MIIKKIKNNTASSVIFFGTNIEPGEYYTIPAIKWTILPHNYSRLIDAVTVGDIIVNDGTNDLSTTEGLWLLTDFQSRKAIDQSFDNSSNGFDSTNLQTALEEIDFRELTKEPTGFVNQGDSAISFSDVNKRFTIAPVSSNFVYYINGHPYIKDASEYVDITDTEGLWYIYYDGSVLTASQTPWDYENSIVFIALIYWDATNNKQIYFADERHGLVMSWAEHKYLHFTNGLKVEPYQLLAGNYELNKDGSSNAHAQLSLTNGTIHDEDLNFDIINSATPTNPFEQKLSTILYVPIYYLNGTVWRKKDAVAFPVYYNSGELCRYNYYNSGTMQWSAELCTNDYYFCIWLMATNNISEPVIAILGQNQYIDPLKADADEQFSALDLSGLPFQEKALLYRAMFRTSTTYTNTPKAILSNLTGPQIPSNLAQAISNKRLNSSTSFQTSSATYVPITNFEIIPESGTYALWFNSDVIIGANNALANTSFFVDGTQIASSERTIQGVGSNFISSVSLLETYGFNGSQTLSVRVKISSGTFYINDRTLVLIRLGPA